VITIKNLDAADKDGQQKLARLPLYFQFFFIILPFVFFLFEFQNPPSVFTKYQYIAIIFLALSYIVAIIYAHRSLARIAFIVLAILVLPIWIERLLADIFGSIPFVNPDILYYASGYMAIIAGFYYLLKSGFPRNLLYKTKCIRIKIYEITALLSLLSAIVLIIYFRLSGKEFVFLSGNGFPAYLAMITIFAFSNGIMEELWFRGMFQVVLSRSFPIRFAVIYQALLFGIIHFDGTPSGPLGMTLAFVFGLALGWLTAYTKSIIPAIIVHVSADFVIGMYL